MSRPRLYDRKQIGKLYKADLSIDEISSLTGASARTIRVVRDELGIPPRKPGGPRHGPEIPIDLRRRAANLYADSSIPLAEVEARTGMCHNTIHRCAAEFGVPRRRVAIDCCKATELYAQWGRLSAVAEILSATREGVRYALERHRRLTKQGAKSHHRHQPRDP